MLALGDRAVQAQSLPPNSSQPSSSPTPTPANAPSTEQAKPRPLRNYIGIGGNIGVSGGNEGISHGGVTIINKKDLNDSLSIRGSTVFGGNRNDSTLALTVNFPVKTSSGQVQLIPFVGGGILLRSKSNFEDLIVRGLVTGGIDVPLSRRFTATTAVKIGLLEKTDVGVHLGIAYNF